MTCPRFEPSRRLPTLPWTAGRGLPGLAPPALRRRRGLRLGLALVLDPDRGGARLRDLEADRFLLLVRAPGRLAALDPDLLQEPESGELRDHGLRGSALERLRQNGEAVGQPAGNVTKPCRRIASSSMISDHLERRLDPPAVFLMPVFEESEFTHISRRQKEQLSMFCFEIAEGNNTEIARSQNTIRFAA
jgi:hypothetical protein